MKKPSFVKVLAVLNSLLVIYLFYLVYDYTQERKTQQPIQFNQNAKAPEPRDTTELLDALTSSNNLQEQVRLVHQLPHNLTEAQASQVYAWLTQILSQPQSLPPLDRLALLDASYRLLISTGFDSETLTQDLLTRLNNQALWLPERNQALIHLIVLHSENPAETESAIIAATKEILQAGNTSLATTCLDGGIFMRDQPSENPARELMDKIALKALEKDFFPATQISALNYSLAYQLDVTEQARKLMQSSPDVSVALAAKRYLTQAQGTKVSESN